MNQRDADKAIALMISVFVATLLLVLILSPLTGLVFWGAWNIGLSELLAAATGWHVGNISFFEAWFSVIGLGVLRGVGGSRVEASAD